MNRRPPRHPATIDYPEKAHPMRAGLPPLPRRIAALPVGPNGYPVPYFVQYINGEPDFRIVDERKKLACVKYHRCWVCGQVLSKFFAFVIGPMCAINRISAEPPSHLECAEWSVKACPFLSRPHMRRRDTSDVEAVAGAHLKDMPGVTIERNPGVTAIWVTKGFTILRTSSGDLFQVGEPQAVHVFAEGRKATQEEVTHSVETGLPLLLEGARAEGEDAVAELARMTAKGCRVLGIPVLVPK